MSAASRIIGQESVPKQPTAVREGWDDYGDQEELPVERTTLPRGTVLYHGTGSGERWEEDNTIEFPAWFSRSPSVARHFSKWRTKEAPRVLTYELAEEVTDLWKVRDEAEFRAVVGSASEADEYVEALQRLGVQGWVLANYRDGDDIFLIGPHHLHLTDNQPVQESKPSDAQIKAGNYPKDHRKVSGIDITVENKSGTTRSGTSEDGKDWSIKMKADYGYVKGRIGSKKVARGKDNDELDIFIKNGTPEDYDGPVFVVNQTKKAGGKGGLDEHKCIIGVKSAEEAKELYLDHYEKGWDRFDGIAEFSTMDAFKDWATSAPQLKAKADGDELHESQQGFELADPDTITAEVDDFYYHVTTVSGSQSILQSQRLEPGHRGTMGRGFYSDYSRGKVFLCEAGAVSYWISKIEDHLFHGSDDPEDVVVLRVPKSMITGLQPDELGTRDSNRPAYYSNRPVVPGGDPEWYPEDDEDELVESVLEPRDADAELDAILNKHVSSGLLQVRVSRGKQSVDCPKMVTLDHLRAVKNAPPGTGSAFMRDFVQWADRHGALIALQTAVGFDRGQGEASFKRTTSTNRLKEFYRRFGFKYSKGSYCYRPDLPGNMHRKPRGVSESARFLVSLALMEGILSDNVIANVREWFGRQPQVPYELADALTHDDVDAANRVLAERGLPPITDPQWERTWDVQHRQSPMIRRRNRQQQLRQPMLAESDDSMPQALADLYDGAGKWEGVDFTAEALTKVCEEIGLSCVWNKDGTTAIVGGQWVIEADPKYPDIEDLAGWLWQATESDAEDFGVSAGDFNTIFWAHPQALYHATPDENVESIRAEGIGAANKTRGLTNRSVGSAVFTSSEYEELYGSGSYGNNIFEINTEAMKADGYMPRVEQEPEVEEAAWRGALAHKIGADERTRASLEQTSSDMSPNTVIVHGSIPPKYIRLV